MIISSLAIFWSCWWPFGYPSVILHITFLRPGLHVPAPSAPAAAPAVSFSHVWWHRTLPQLLEPCSFMPKTHITQCLLVGYGWIHPVSTIHVGHILIICVAQLPCSADSFILLGWFGFPFWLVKFQFVYVDLIHLWFWLGPTLLGEIPTFMLIRLDPHFLVC